MSKSTEKQAAVLTAIRAYQSAHGYPPSARDVALATGLTPAAVYYAIKALEADGRIRRQSGKARTFVVQDVGAD